MSGGRETERKTGERERVLAVRLEVEKYEPRRKRGLQICIFQLELILTSSNTSPILLHWSEPTIVRAFEASTFAHPL